MSTGKINTKRINQRRFDALRVEIPFASLTKMIGEAEKNLCITDPEVVIMIDDNRIEMTLSELVERLTK